MDVAGRRSCAAAFPFRPGASVCSRTAPRHRCRRLRGRPGARAQIGDRDVRRHGAVLRQHHHDRDGRRSRRHAHAPRLDRRLAGLDGHRRGGCRDDRHTGRHRRRSGVRPARRAHRLGGAGLSRSGVAPSYTACRASADRGRFRLAASDERERRGRQHAAGTADGFDVCSRLAAHNGAGRAGPGAGSRVAHARRDARAAGSCDRVDAGRVAGLRLRTSSSGRSRDRRELRCDDDRTRARGRADASCGSNGDRGPPGA